MDELMDELKEAAMPDKKKVKHIKLTSHPGLPGSETLKPIKWGAPTPKERGPIIATVTNSAHRNVIGTHSGSYTVYRALAVAAGALKAEHRPDLTNTSPAESLGPFPQRENRPESGASGGFV